MAGAAAVALGVAAATAWWIAGAAPDDAPLRFAKEIESLTFLVRGEEDMGEWEVESAALREISRELASDFDAKGFVKDDFHIIGSQQLWRKGQEVVQFRFRDASDRKYTVFVTTRRQDPASGYRLAEEGGRRIAYWADGPAVFAVTTQAEAEKLMQLVQAIDRSVCTEDQFLADRSH
jgi:hypothetical protein